MTTSPASDQERNAVLDRLSAELADLGRRVEGVRTDLGTLRAAPSPAVPPWRPHRPAAPPTGTPLSNETNAPFAAPRSATAPFAPNATPPNATPPGATPPGATPPGTAAPRGTNAAFAASRSANAPFAPYGRPPQPQAPARSLRATIAAPGALARLLAIAGGAVTLLGVVLLLVLAANRGWFGPGARLIGGAVLGAVLVGTGVRLRNRLVATDGTSPAGAVALVATGVAALYLDLAAAAALYDYLPLVAALPLALAVAGGGLALADRWRHRGLAVGVLAGVDLLLPVVLGAVTPLLVALVLVVQVAAVPVVLRRGWSAPAVVATGASALAALSVAIRYDVVGGSAVTTTAAVVAVAVAAVVTAVLVDRTLSRPVLACCVLVSGLFPALLAALLLPTAFGAPLAGGLAAALLAVAVLLERGLFPAGPGAGALAATAGAGAGLAALTATALALDGVALGIAIVGEAVVLAVAAAVTRRAGVLVAAGAFGLVGMLRALAADVSLDTLVGFSGPEPASVLTGRAAVALLLVALGVTGLLALARLELLGTRERAYSAAAVLGLVSLYGATGVVVTLALLVSPTRTGFVIGHVLVTVSWTIVALVLLVRGLARVLPRVLGATLVIAALAKLVLFDLTALDGLPRVAAFLGAGIVLLLAGAGYARAIADTTDAPDEAPLANR